MCISEERLNRVKNWAGFPALAVQEVLRLAGLEVVDVDRLVLHRDRPGCMAGITGKMSQVAWVAVLCH